MVNVRVTKRRMGTTSPEKLSKDLQLLAAMTPIQLQEIAAETQTFIRVYINKNRKRKPRPSGKPSLANAFKVGGLIFTPDGISLTIGNKEELDRNFDYWYLIEVGGWVPRQKYGYFGQHQRPDKNLRGIGTEYFHEAKSFIDSLTGLKVTMLGGRGTNSPGQYFMRPKVAVEGMHYIYNTNEWLRRRWAGWWEKKQRQILKS